MLKVKTASTTVINLRRRLVLPTKLAVLAVVDRLQSQILLRALKNQDAVTILVDGWITMVMVMVARFTLKERTARNIEISTLVQVARLPTKLAVLVGED